MTDLAVAPPPPPMTELKGLQLKCNELTDESLDSTRRMKSMCEEAKDSGIKTLVMLDHQGEQLEKCGEGLDQMKSEIDVAKQVLKEMDYLCGIFPKFWKKSARFKEDDAVWKQQRVWYAILTFDPIFKVNNKIEDNYLNNISIHYSVASWRWRNTCC